MIDNKFADHMTMARATRAYAPQAAELFGPVLEKPAVEGLTYAPMSLTPEDLVATLRNAMQRGEENLAVWAATALGLRRPGLLRLALMRSSLENWPCFAALLRVAMCNAPRKPTLENLEPLVCLAVAGCRMHKTYALSWLNRVLVGHLAGEVVMDEMRPLVAAFEPTLAQYVLGNKEKHEAIIRKLDNSTEMSYVGKALNWNTLLYVMCVLRANKQLCPAELWRLMHRPVDVVNSVPPIQPLSVLPIWVFDMTTKFGCSVLRQDISSYFDSIELFRPRLVMPHDVFSVAGMYHFGHGSSSAELYGRVLQRHNAVQTMKVVAEQWTPPPLEGYTGVMLMGPPGVSNAPRVYLAQHVVSGTWHVLRGPARTDADIDRLEGAIRSDWLRVCVGLPTLNAGCVSMRCGKFLRTNFVGPLPKFVTGNFSREYGVRLYERPANVFHWAERFLAFSDLAVEMLVLLAFLHAIGSPGVGPSNFLVDESSSTVALVNDSALLNVNQYMWPARHTSAVYMDAVKAHFPVLQTRIHLMCYSLMCVSAASKQDRVIAEIVANSLTELTTSPTAWKLL